MKHLKIRITGWGNYKRLKNSLDLKKKKSNGVLCMCQCVVKRACISGVKGLEVDLEVTSSITWTGPGDRKQLQQSWRCLQEIY